MTGLIAFLSASAGLLSAIGLYLVLSFLVFQRRRSTAIRTALGASRARVAWQHARTSAGLLMVAVPAGALLAAASGPFIEELLYGVRAQDAGSLLLAIAIAIAAALVGTVVPVTRAAGANVVEVLRGE